MESFKLVPADYYQKDNDSNQGINNSNNINHNIYNHYNDTYSLSYGKCNSCLCNILIGFAIIFGGISSVINVPIFSAIVIAVLLVLLFILLIFSKRNILFEKFEDKNILTAKVYNYFGCRCKKKSFNYLKTIQFDIKTLQTENNDNIYRLFIFNNLSNIKGYNLEGEQIRIKPLELYYYFDKVKPGINDKESIKRGLNGFSNSPLDFDCPLFFDFFKYKSRDINSPVQNFSNISATLLMRLMRFSDYFITYHVRDPNEKFKVNKCGCLTIYIIINIWLCFMMTFVVILGMGITNVFFYVLLIISPSLLFDIIVYLVEACLSNRILRIDCIFSSDFDRIFIGLTTINEKKYKNTFEFQLNEMNKFIINEYNNLTFFSVRMNNNNITDICNITNKEDIDLDDFVSLLNEKLNK
jgi:hypothetical protein